MSEPANTNGMQIPVEELLALAFKGRAKTLLERLKALPWKQLSLRDDLDSLRRVLQALEATKGVRVAHRFVSRKVLSAAERLHVVHGQRHECSFAGVAMTPDGTRFATADQGGLAYDCYGKIQVWDALAGRSIAWTEAPLGTGFGGGMRHDDQVLQWSPTGEQLAVSTQQGAVWGWNDPLLGTAAKADDERAGNLLFCWCSDGFSVCCMDENQDDFAIGVYDLVPGATINQLRTLKSNQGIDVEYDVPHLVLFAKQQKIYAKTRWEVASLSIATGALLHSCGTPLRCKTTQKGVRWSLDGSVCAVEREQHLALLQTEDASVLAILPTEGVLDVQLDATGEHVALAKRHVVQVYRCNPPVLLASIEHGVPELSPIDGRNDQLFAMGSVAFSSQGNLFARLRNSGAISLYDEQYRFCATVPSHASTIGMSFGKDDRVLVTWGNEVVEWWGLDGVSFGRPVFLLGRAYATAGTPSAARGELQAPGFYQGTWNVPLYEPLPARDFVPFVGYLKSASIDYGFVFSSPWVREVFCLFFASEQRCAVLVHPPGMLDACALVCSFVLEDRYAWPLHWALKTPFVCSADHWKAVVGLLPKDIASLAESFTL